MLFTPNADGTYFIAAGSFITSQRDQDVGTYTLQVSIDDFRGDTGTTGTVAVGGSVIGEIEAQADRDWFAVTLEAGKTYQFDMEGSTTGGGTLENPFLLTMRDADGDYVRDADGDYVRDARGWQMLSTSDRDDGDGLNARGDVHAGRGRHLLCGGGKRRTHARRRFLWPLSRHLHPIARGSGGRYLSRRRFPFPFDRPDEKCSGDPADSRQAVTTRPVRDRDAGGAREIRAALGESRRLFFSIGLFSAFVNLLMLTGPLFMLQVYDRVLTSRSEATLVALVLIVAFLFLMMGLLDHFRARVLARAGARLPGRASTPVCWVRS